MTWKLEGFVPVYSVVLVKSLHLGRDMVKNKISSILENLSPKEKEKTHCHNFLSGRLDYVLYF